MPDGIKNSEAVMIDPLTKDIFVVSKENVAVVYQAKYPQDLTKVNTLKKIAVLPFTLVTAADISPDGKEILIKTYTQVFYWKKSGNESIAELLKKTPVSIPYLYETQGEAICFADDNSGFYTTTERAGTTQQFIYFYKRK